MKTNFTLLFYLKKPKNYSNDVATLYLRDRSHDRVLPVSSNQKMNEYLVEIAALSQVNKKIGRRIAKRTFATIVTLMNGVPIESVSKSV